METSVGIRDFNLIVCIDNDTRGIGSGGKLLFDIPEDKNFFRSVTSTIEPKTRVSYPKTKNVLISGRKTWEEFGRKTLPGRILGLVSTTAKATEKDSFTYGNLYDCLHHASNLPRKEANEIFVIGGEGIYKEAILSPRCKTVYLTRVSPSVALGCDAYMPEFEEHYELAEKSETMSFNDEKNGYSVSFVFEVYERKVNKGEQAYLDLLGKILSEGSRESNRTGVDAFVKFGTQLEFDLSDGSYPLLTSKKVNFDWIAKEMRWFLSGSTDAGELDGMGVPIWNDDASKKKLEALQAAWDAKGRPDLVEVFKNRRAGDLGPVYGFNWRHFGAKYVDCDTDYTGQGFDQIAYIIHKIKTDPSARDILLTSWDPNQIDLANISPCHAFCQFHVDKEGRLSGHLYQRSADMALGVPFNIASYALLIIFLAKICGLKPGKLVHSFGNAHIYANHVEKVMKWLERSAGQFPKLKITGKLDSLEDLEAWKFDLNLEDYNPQRGIQLALNTAVVSNAN